MKNFTKFYITKRYPRVGRCYGIISGWVDNGILRTEVFPFYENVLSELMPSEEFAYSIKSEDWAPVAEIYHTDEITEVFDLLGSFVSEYGYNNLLKCCYNFLDNEYEKLNVNNFSTIEFSEVNKYEYVTTSVWRIKYRSPEFYDKIKTKTNSPTLKEIISKVDKIGAIINPTSDFN